MPAELSALAEAVDDEASFLAFLEALARDWDAERDIERASPSSAFGAGALGWENGSIGAFLEAATAWARATNRDTTRDEPPQSPWRRIAHILLAGKFYE